MSDFHIDATVQSQYSASPHILNLVDAFWECIDPEADIESIYNNMVNPDTAAGFGLDVWGRIVAIGREYIAVDESAKYFGYKPIADPSGRIDTFNRAPFYKSFNGKVRLEDNAYRTYIFIKALINIGDSSLAYLNRVFAEMFPEAKICVIHIDTMSLRIVIQSYLSEADKAALLKLPWLPAGVRLEMFQVIVPTFGFLGSELYPFNQGTFGYTAPEPITL